MTVRVIGLLAALSLLQPGWARTPEISPRDVYPVVQQVVSDLHALRAQQGVINPIEAVPLLADTTPTDNYAAAYRLLEKVVALSSAQGRLVSEIPERRSGRQVPADVLELLQGIQSELAALKQALGVSTPGQEFHPRPGASPAEVGQLLERALALVDTL